MKKYMKKHNKQGKSRSIQLKYPTSMLFPTYFAKDMT